jgi:hypothetical protein
MVKTLQRYIGRIWTFRGVVPYRLWCPGGLGRAGKFCTVLYSVIQCYGVLYNVWKAGLCQAQKSTRGERRLPVSLTRGVYRRETGNG